MISIILRTPHKKKQEVHNRWLLVSLLRLSEKRLEAVPGIYTQDYELRIKSLITLIGKLDFTTEELLEALNMD